MKSKIIKTSQGFEPAFFYDDVWNVEPGFAESTRKAAEQKLAADSEQCRVIDAQQRLYAAQYAHACGYHN